MTDYADKFVRHIDLTDDCGATVAVRYWSVGEVSLSMGGDLSISITIPRDAAIELGQALVAAANTPMVTP